MSVNNTFTLNVEVKNWEIKSLGFWKSPCYVLKVQSLFENWREIDINNKNEFESFSKSKFLLRRLKIKVVFLFGLLGVLKREFYNQPAQQEWGRSGLRQVKNRLNVLKLNSEPKQTSRFFFKYLPLFENFVLFTSCRNLTKPNQFFLT